MARRTLVRTAAVLGAASLALAGCSSDKSDDSSSSGSTSGASAATTSVTTDCTPEQAKAGATPSTEALRIGTLLPDTGSLSFLGPPMVAGTQLGVNDVNAAGGVLGQPVQLIPGDSGDTTTDTANTTVDRELAAGTQVIVGAASSSVSLKVIDKIASAGVVMFSPANTSDQFVCYPDKGMYFRTAPTDVLQAQAVAQLISDDGGQRVAIMALNDPYGTGLADNIEKNLIDSGVPSDQIEKIIYDPNAQSFNSEVDQVKNFNPDAVALVGFEESAKIITRMHEVGIGPSDGMAMYGVDGNMGNALGESVAKPLLDTMQGTTPLTERRSCLPGSSEGCEPLSDRLQLRRRVIRRGGDLSARCRAGEVDGRYRHRGQHQQRHRRRHQVHVLRRVPAVGEGGNRHRLRRHHR